MLAKILSSTVLGIDGVIVDVEVDISNGLPYFSLVGLPDVAVRESKDRVKAAIKNSSYEFPNKKITVNLAPADLKKEGAGFDLPLAIGLLTAQKHIDSKLCSKILIVGELSLDGSVKSVAGALSMAIEGVKYGCHTIILPMDNIHEASVVAGMKVVGVNYLHQAVDYLRGSLSIENIPGNDRKADTKKEVIDKDYSDVKGQSHVKRALEIAAAGNHNIMLYGPPGSGKTMLARRLPTILPDMVFAEALETTKVYSTSKLLNSCSSLMTVRPFRAPHHSISDAGLIGGGINPKPGEISLAHNGVLFLDELPEFKRNVLEALRQPLEDGEVTISRANFTFNFPSRFMLVSSLNPCPCGFHGANGNKCVCTVSQIQRYHQKLSGPLLDRIDICVEVPTLPYSELKNDEAGEKSADIKERVKKCRTKQLERFTNVIDVRFNGQMNTRQIEQNCGVNSETEKLIKMSVEKLGLSARGYHKLLKIARTIADMDGSKIINKGHVAEAIQFRRVSFLQ